MDFALFEDTLNPDTKNSFLFTKPVITIELFAENWNTVTEQLLSLQQQGYYLAGYIAYDAATSFFSPDAMDIAHLQNNPLASFTAYKEMEQFCSCDLVEILAKHNINLVTGQLTPKIFNFFEFEYDFEEYQQRYKKVQEALKRGDSYQINLTLNTTLTSTIKEPFTLYYHLSRNHPVQYATFLPGATTQVISISPELFFRKNKNTLQVRPMKGTLPRGKTEAEDQINSKWLQTDAKNLAENLIIVDLLRNDLAKFSIPGSIKATKLFQIEKYASLFQMTSEIESSIAADLPFTTIIEGLFPCGSITGAPKRRTMELINQIESRDRGVYCGAIGFVTPQNDMTFNVAIRTLCKSGENEVYRLGVGGGLTVNSKPQDEWDEIKTKLDFVYRLYQPDFALVESLKIVAGTPLNLELHLERLNNSASRLGFKINRNLILQRIMQYLDSHPELSNEVKQEFKLRIETDFDHNILIGHSKIFPANKKPVLAVLSKPIDTSHLLFRHKTTSLLTRGLYDNLYREDKPENIDELIFVNHNGIITESRYFNYILQHEDKFYTSPLSEGLLPGIYRKNLIDGNRLIESAITPEMLVTAQKHYLCNDVRGLVECIYAGKI